MANKNLILIIAVCFLGLNAGAEMVAANDASDVMLAKLVVDPQTKPTERVAAVETTASAAAALEKKESRTEVMSEPKAEPKAEVKAEVKAEASRLPENQIPVLTGGKDLKRASGSGIGRIIITLGVFTVLFAGLAFGLRRWMQRKVPGLPATKIRILSQHPLGPKKSVAIIQVAGEALLIGITDHNISMLKTLALIDDEIPEEQPQRFDHALSDFDDMDEAQSTNLAIRKPHRQEPEEFAMRGLKDIRDTVSTRSRGMKSY